MANYQFFFQSRRAKDLSASLYIFNCIITMNSYASTFIFLAIRRLMC